MSANILIIDDDEKLSAMVVEYLTKNGFRAEAVASPSEGLKRIAATASGPDLLVLDLMMPEMDGLEVCREVRRHSQLPILMLTGRGDEADRIVGLELGADDYLAKPFNPRELLARIRSILRRASATQAAAAGGATKGVLKFPRLTIDAERREAKIGEERVELTSTEFDLLHVFALNRGVVLSRDAILTKVRGARFEAFDRSIDVHVSHLRQKIEVDPKSPRTIKTVWGEGYLFTGE